MNRNCQHFVVNIDGYLVPPRKENNIDKMVTWTVEYLLVAIRVLMAHCSLCCLLINGSGLGQKG